MRRKFGLAVPGLALATLGELWIEAKRAAHAPLPQFADNDPSGTYGDPDGDPVHIGLLGDSSMTGPGLQHPSQIWIAALADRMSWNITLNSHALGGSRVADVLAEQTGIAVLDRPDLFVVSVGANDAAHGVPAPLYARRLREMFEVLVEVAPVVSLGVGDMTVIPRIPPRLRPLLGLRCAAIDRAHARVTREFDQVLRVPVRDISDEHFRRGGLELFAADLFHPNDVGHGLWAELFGPYLNDAIDVAGTRHGGGPANFGRNRECERPGKDMIANNTVNRAGSQRPWRPGPHTAPNPARSVLRST